VQLFGVFDLWAVAIGRILLLLSLPDEVIAASPVTTVLRGQILYFGECRREEGTRFNHTPSLANPLNILKTQTGGQRTGYRVECDVLGAIAEQGDQEERG